MVNSNFIGLLGVTVLVTGVSGFIASHLIPSLCRAGAHVYGVSRSKKIEQYGLADCFIADISDVIQMSKVLTKVQPTYVIHLAGSKVRDVTLKGFRKSIEDNLLGTFNLVEACVNQGGVKRFISLGSCEEYGQIEGVYQETMREESASAYSYSKVAVTHMLQALSRSHDIDICILRPSVVYGPNQGDSMFIPALIKALLRHDTFAMTSGEQTRDFVYIEDLVDAIIKAAGCCENNLGIINICNGNSMKIIEVATKVVEILGQDTIAFIKVGTKPYRSGEAINYNASNQKAASLLGWHPQTSLSKGLTETIEYFSSRTN